MFGYAKLRYLAYARIFYHVKAYAELSSICDSMIGYLAHVRIHLNILLMLGMLGELAHARICLDISHVIGCAVTLCICLNILAYAKICSSI